MAPRQPEADTGGDQVLTDEPPAGRKILINFRGFFLFLKKLKPWISKCHEAMGTNLSCETTPTKTGWVPGRREAAVPEARCRPSSPSAFQGTSRNDGHHQSDSVLPSSFLQNQSCCTPSGSSKALHSAGTGHHSHWKQTHHSHHILLSVFRRTRCARNRMNRDEGTVPSLMKSSPQTQRGQEMITWLWFPLAMFS